MSNITVGIPAIEPSYEASIPALVAIREAIEALQGKRTPLDAPLAAVDEPLPQVQTCKLTDQIIIGSVPKLAPGCDFAVAAGKSLAFRYVVHFRTRASNLDLGVVVARPGGPSVVGVFVDKAV